MWMMYSEQSWPIATDILSAVQRVQCIMEALRFDASHHAVYGFGDVDSCNKLEQRYTYGYNVCQTFLNGGVCGLCLCKKLRRHELEEFACQIEKFLLEGEEDEIA